MRLGPAKYRLRWLSGLLALCLLLGSFSVVTGLCITSGPAHPEISLDVCHPLQAPNLVTIVLIARPVSGLSEPLIFPRGAIVETALPQVTEFVLTPDPPPPKSLI